MQGLRVQDAVAAAVAYLLTMLGITLGYHRTLAHRSIVLEGGARTTFVALGAMAAQGPPVFWVSHHRAHHGHADGPLDPHSPHVRRGGWLNALLGFVHAHVGWMF